MNFKKSPTTGEILFTLSSGEELNIDDLVNVLSTLVNQPSQELFDLQERQDLLVEFARKQNDCIEKMNPVIAELVTDKIESSKATVRLEDLYFKYLKSFEVLQKQFVSGQKE
jgi:argininosuccinate lyase